MADPNLADFNPVFQQRLADFQAALAKAGINANVISGYRTPEYQGQMYANHLAKQAGRPLPYPGVEAPSVVAPAWRSFHNYGLAADFTAANPADYARMRTMAPQFGLSGIGASDPGHIQMSGTLADDINQYHLANWRPTGQPAPGQGAIAYSGGPPPGQPPPTMVARTGAPAAGSSFLDALHQIESNNRNIYSGVDKDYPGQPNSRSQGYDQIDVPTWLQFGKQAGVDLTKYPTPLSAPPEVQDRVASQIPLSRFGGRTQRMLAHQFGQLDTSKTVGQLATQFAQPGTTINTTGPSSPSAAGGPAAPAGGSPLAKALSAAGQALGGPAAPAGASGDTATPQSPLTKALSGAGKTLGGGGKGGSGGDDQQPSMPPMQLAPPMATGGPMMLGPGGQNSFGQRAAQQMLAQQGFQTQPSLQYGGANAMPSPVPSMPASQATGIPGLPGTTLNSPSQLQMALMTGQLSPYDLYAQQQAAGGGGSNYYG